MSTAIFAGLTLAAVAAPTGVSYLMPEENLDVEELHRLQHCLSEAQIPIEAENLIKTERCFGVKPLPRGPVPGTLGQKEFARQKQNPQTVFGGEKNAYFFGKNNQKTVSVGLIDAEEVIVSVENTKEGPRFYKKEYLPGFKSGSERKKDLTQMVDQVRQIFHDPIKTQMFPGWKLCLPHFEQKCIFEKIKTKLESGEKGKVYLDEHKFFSAQPVQSFQDLAAAIC